MATNPRINSNPEICGGDPCVAGTRIQVHVVLGHLAGGATFEEILQNFPTLRREDITACLEYAATLCAERAIAV